MKTIYIASFIALLLLASGCTGNAQPTVAPLPPSAIPLLDQAETPVSVPTDLIASLVPHGQPASEWKGIPIMPGALDGEGDENAYRFTTQATAEDIETFYKIELARFGWEMLGVGEGDKGALLLLFDAGEGAVSISILPNGETLLVVITK